MSCFNVQLIGSGTSLSGIAEDFLNYSPLPELMQGAGMAVLTLLVSFAIGIFIHHLGDGARRGNFLDLHIALDYVWLFKPSLFVLLVVVTAPFFMGAESLIFKVVIFSLWAIALLALLWILLRLYGWVKGDKDDYRLRYFSNFPKSQRDQIVSWRDFWSSSINSDNRFNEKDFFVPFSREIDRLIKSDNKEDLNMLVRLLDGFASNIEKRNKIFLLIFPEFFPKVLEWHFILWKRQYLEFAKDKSLNSLASDHGIFEAELVVNQIIKFLTKEAIVGTSRAFSYFKTLETHVEKFGSYSIAGEEHVYDYLDQLPIYENCLDLIPKSQDSYSIWNHYFPESWKVTIHTYEHNLISRIWYARFLEWSRSRLWNENKDWDKDLEEVSKALFPDVDPITWAKIYTFVVRPFSELRIEEMIKKSTNFGYAGRVFTSWGNDIEKDFARVQEGEYEATIELALYLFGRVFTRENLEKWLRELTDLEYPEDSDEFRRKHVWEGIFKSLLKQIRNQKG